MTNSCCCGNLPVCLLHLGENGFEKYRLAKKWEQFKIVLLFMDHPVLVVRYIFILWYLLYVSQNNNPIILSVLYCFISSFAFSLLAYFPPTSGTFLTYAGAAIYVPVGRRFLAVSCC